MQRRAPFDLSMDPPEDNLVAAKRGAERRRLLLELAQPRQCLLSLAHLRSQGAYYPSLDPDAALPP